MKYAMEIQILVWKKTKYDHGIKTLNESQSSDYFNYWSPNKDIKKQYKKPSHIHYHSKNPHHEQHELQHKDGQDSTKVNGHCS